MAIAEQPTQIQPTIPAPPSGRDGGLSPHEPQPYDGGPGEPPRPPKRPTGGSGGGGGDFGGDGPGGDDDANRKRLTGIVAGVGVALLVVLFLLLSGSDSDDDGTVTPTSTRATEQLPATLPGSGATTPTATTPAHTTPTATEAPSTPAASTPTATTPATSPSGGASIGGSDDTSNGPTLSAGSVTKIKVKQGDTVTFNVESDTPQEVHVHGYDKAYDLDGGATKTISFKANLTGIFEIEFEGTSTQIGELTVEP
jgi:hypothetical protein